jgi:uncharacterized protein YihD (DUF1040 family)
MRDENRIPEICRLLEIFWSDPKNIDLRLGQLLWMIADRDPFYMEDTDLIKYLKEHI